MAKKRQGVEGRPTKRLLVSFANDVLQMPKDASFTKVIATVERYAELIDKGDP